MNVQLETREYAYPLDRRQILFADMRPLRYSINVTLDGCCDHRVGIADEALHRHAIENIAWADALLFGRVTYEMMEVAWRSPNSFRRVIHWETCAPGEAAGAPFT